MLISGTIQKKLLNVVEKRLNTPDIHYNTGIKFAMFEKNVLALMMVKSIEEINYNLKTL